MPYPLPLTRTEAYLAYKAGVIQQSDLKPSLAVSRNGIDAWLAYWTGLAADYPKREDGNPHILQEEEAYIAYLCGVINEYPEKCLRRVGAYLRYLISARWGRPDRPLNREELYLSLIKTQVIPSGDPSSDIVIDGTAKAPFQDVKMYGDTYQQSYEGKNLFNSSNPMPSYGGLSSTYDATTGMITTTGVPLADYTDVVPNRNITDLLEDGTTYTVSQTETESPKLLYCEVSAPKSGGGTDYYGTSFTVNKSTHTQYRIHVVTGTRENWGTSSRTFKRGYMLEKSASATTFEPYVGGTPSPSPEYPQQIQTVTGLQTVEVKGKNLLSSVWEPGTYSTTNGGKQALANTYRTAEKVAVQSDTTYIVSRDSVGLGMNYYEYDANGNFLTYTLKSANQSITTGQTTKFITMSRSQTGGFEKMMLEGGSTITAYEPYSSNAYEINLVGKNLFDGIFELGNINPTTGVNTSSNTTIRTKNYVAIKGGENYTISVVGGGNVALGFYQSNGTFIGVGTTGASPNTFTAPANAGRVRFIIAYNTNISTKAQCEAGSQATAYAPYFTPIELCKLGTYQDYIWKDGDTWKVHKAIDSLTLNGTEDWAKANSGTSNWYYQVIGLTQNTPIEGEGYIISTHYAGAKVYNTNTNEGICATKTSKSLRIRYGNEDTTTNFKTWLSSNNVGVYYVLTTATDAIITNKALIAQLEALVAGGAEDGTTYIKVNATDPNLPGLLVVEAPKYE